MSGLAKKTYIIDGDKMENNRRRFLLSCAAGLLTSSAAGTVLYRNDDHLVWKKEPALPVPLQEIYPASFAGEIYVGGGFTPSDEPVFADYGLSTEMYVLNTERRVWRSAPKFPEARHHLGLVANSDFLFGVGGFSAVPGNVWKAESTVFKLARESKQWIAGPSLPLPQAESTYGTIRENIHVVGGKRIIDGKTRNSNKHLVLIDNEYWEEAAPASIKRNSAAGAVINQRLYVVGGRQFGGYDKNLFVAEAYDPSLDKWEQIKPAPVALAGHAAATKDGKLYMFGGEVFGTGGNWKTGKAFSNVWVYDPEKDDWQRHLDMPENRHGLGAVTLGRKIFILGGGQASGPRGVTTSVLSI